MRRTFEIFEDAADEYRWRLRASNGEIVPKSYGLANAERLALAVVRPLAVVETVLYPVVVAFDLVTRVLTDAVGGTTAIERQYESEEA